MLPVLLLPVCGRSFVSLLVNEVLRATGNEAEGEKYVMESDSEKKWDGSAMKDEKLMPEKGIRVRFCDASLFLDR